MKDKILIKKTKLHYHKERSFFTALKLSAIEHGYIGFFSNTRFLFRKLHLILYGTYFIAKIGEGKKSILNTS